MKPVARGVLILALLACAVLGRAAHAQGALEATTSTGEKVRLLPDGRWEWVEPQKAAAQRSERAAEAKRQDDVRQAELRRERGAQGGGQLGFGRTVYEGDRDYNRGSLNPKLR